MSVADTDDREVSDPAIAALDTVLAALAGLLDRLGRHDLRDRTTAARVRLSRPSTVVCVVGEFKQGKSSLVNGLVGTDVCPVDDDIATSVITVVRHGDPPHAVVRTRTADGPGAEQVPFEELAAHVTEAGTPVSGTVVERVDVGVPSSLLAGGLALVDTPGMGGLGAGHAAATLAFLPFADGLVFVTDAARELTAPEVRFLERARELCPTVLLVVTKCDLTPNWRRIVEIDTERLTALVDPSTGAATSDGIGVVAVSSTVRAEALRAGDRELNQRSGYPDLIAALDERVLRVAAVDALDRARREAGGVIDTVRTALESELEMLDDPAAREELARAADDARARLDQLRSGGARWSTVLGDRMTDLSNDTSHTFRSRIRDASSRIEERIETIRTAEEWDELGRELQGLVAEAVTEAFVALERGHGEIRDDIARMLAADDVITPASSRQIDPIDVNGLWRSRDLDPAERAGSKAVRTGMTGLRGAQGGVMMFAIGGQFLPQAGAVFLLSNPVLLGAGLAFGGYQLLEERKRKVSARRQAARTQLRQFTDMVSFEVGNDLGIRVRSIQRELRDEFIGLISELQQTWTSAAAAAEEARSLDTRQTEERRSTIAAMLAELGRCARGLAAPEAADTGTSGPTP